jgi:hypothetical protein
MPEIILRDSFPVLLEGLHTTGDMNRFADGNRVILVRTHNIEHRYYSLLSRSEKGLFRKIFLITESIKLAGYEKILTRADHVLAISKDETDYFNGKFRNAHFIPPFHRFSEATPITGKGSYILYHGNLGVAENSSIFLRLARELLRETSYRFIVAGKNPKPRFIKALAKYPRIELVPDPDDEKIAYLIRNAQVNLLVTEQSTGLKLKLLHALFAGRHCLVNTKMVKGTGLEQLCRIADTPMETIRLLDELMQVPFTDKEVRERKRALKDYSNRACAEKILRIIA